MGTEETFNWSEAAKNWQEFIGQGLKDGAGATWDAITSPMETGTAIKDSLKPTVRAIYDELAELGDLGIEESKARLKPLFDKAVEAGEMTADEVADFNKRLFSGEISWDDTKSYFAELGKGFAETSKKIGRGASEAAGNVARSLPFMLTALGTIGVTAMTVSGMVGVESWFSLKGLLAGLMTAGIATVAVPMLAGTVHNWYYGHNKGAEPEAGAVPTREAALAPVKETKVAMDVSDVSLPMTVTSVKYAVASPDAVGSPTIAAGESAARGVSA